MQLHLDEEDRVWELLETCRRFSHVQRVSFLQSLAVTEPAVAQALDQELREDDELGGFLEEPIAHRLLDSIEPILPPEALIDNKYQIVEELTPGNQGDVYVAQRVSDYSARVVLKLARGANIFPEVRDVFYQERQNLADLNGSPHIVIIHDGGEYDGVPYMVTEYVVAAPITHYFDGSTNRRELLKTFTIVADAVGVAHALQNGPLVHADLKPDHIRIIGPEHIKILDFGAAVRGTEGAGPIGYTKAWASPEQLAHERPTPASDVYTLGLLLRHLLHRSHHGRSFNLPPRRELDAIVDKCLRAAAGDRYPNATALAHDLRAYVDWRPTSLDFIPLHHRVGKFAHRHSTFILASATMAMLVVAVWLLLAFLGNYRTNRILRIVAQAREQLSTDPRAALELAYAASGSGADPATLNTLRRAIGNPLKRLIHLPDANVRRMTFSSNGATLAVAGSAGDVTLFDVSSGRPIWTPVKDQSDVTDLDFMAGDRFLTIHSSMEAAIYDVRTQQSFFRTPLLVTTLASTVSSSGKYFTSWDHDTKALTVYTKPDCCSRSGSILLIASNEPPSSIVVSSDDATIAVTIDGRVKVFTRSNGRLLRTIGLNNLTARSACYISTANSLIVGFNDGTISQFDARGKHVTSITSGQRPLTHVGCAPTGNLVLALGEDGSASIVDVALRRAIARLSTEHSPGSLTWTGWRTDNELVLLGSAEGYVGAWDWRRRTSADWHRPHTASITRGVATDDWIVTESSDGTTRLWNLRTSDTMEWFAWRDDIPTDNGTHRLVPRTPVLRANSPEPYGRIVIGREAVSSNTYRPVANWVPGTPGSIPIRLFSAQHISVSSDGQSVAAIREGDHLSIWSTQLGTWLRDDFTRGSTVSAVEFVPGTHRGIALESGNDIVHFFDADNPAKHRRLQSPGRWYGSLSNSHGGCLTAAIFETEIRIWNNCLGDLISSVPIPSGRGGLQIETAIDAQNGLIAIAEGNNVLKLWQLRQEQTIDSSLAWENHPPSPSSIGFDTTGRFAAATIGGTTTAYDLAKREMIVRSSTDGEETAPIEQASFAPDGPYLIVPDRANRLSLWDLMHRHKILECCQNSTHVAEVVFSPDGELFGSRTDAGELFVWRRYTGELVKHLRGQSIDQRWSALAFSPDSRTIAATDGGSLRFENVFSRTQPAPQAILPDEQEHAREVKWSRNNLVATITQRGAGAGSDYLTVIDASRYQRSGIQQQAGLHEAITFSPSGRLLAVNSDGQLRVWNTTSKSIIATLSGPGTIFRSVSFSRDEQLIAALCVNDHIPSPVGSTILVWDLSYQNTLIELPGEAVAIDPNGSGLIVVSHGVVAWYDTPELGDAELLRKTAKHLLNIQ
jgi:WD40 repeat protein